ncbi:MAG TPA: amidase [Terriglobia bacterium]|nr:amidase [Terriglobia bacterium]
MADLTQLTATEMVQAVRATRVSPVAVVEAHLDRIAKLNPRLNAFVIIDEDGARAQARRIEAAIQRGERVGPLAGVPVTIKSSIDVAGWRCAAGSRLRANYIAAVDAPLVARLKTAGAVVLGSTNTPEMLMAYETDNLLHGRTNNPWDLDRTPGGSSGGESAAIAAGCSAAGVGSDGGGSVRVPAHYTGICALKPTPGRIPATGHFPASAGPFAQIGVVGPMAHSIADLTLMFEAMAGPELGDPSAAPVLLRVWNDAEMRSVPVGFFEEGGRTPVTPETRAAVRAAAETLQRAGFDVQPFCPTNLDLMRELWWDIFGRAGGFVLKPFIGDREADLSPILREFMSIVAADPPLTLEQLIETLIERDRIRAELLAEMERFPVLLCPVCAVPAFRHGERSWSVNGQTVKYLDAMSYTQWWNIMGNPAAVVPVGRSPKGLPIGVQVVGRPWEEELVLRVAGEIERGVTDDFRLSIETRHSKLETRLHGSDLCLDD